MANVLFTKSISTSDLTSSPRLLNWVEPFKVSGLEKTLFYTEVNTNLKVGDKVFIINGNYDNSSLISANKYKKGRDGYSVINIDNCKVVLDIDYTGVLPFIDSDVLDDFIKVYYVDSSETFLNMNRQVSSRAGTFSYKFDYNQNNIAFINKDFSPITQWGYNGGATSAPGFFVRNGTQSWTNISNDFINSGSYSYALSPTYINNDRIKIINKSFTYNGLEFKEGYVYKWDSDKWVVDNIYQQSIVTKTNFRGGKFKGEFNSGLFGTTDKKTTWGGDGKWNGGTLLNTKWSSGDIHSTLSLPVSYKSTFNENGVPYQKITNDNNSGYGFNYIIDCDIERSNIDNANIINTKISSTSSIPITENHILSTETIFTNTISSGYFDTCEFSNVNLKGGIINNSRTNNSLFTNVKSINSSYEKSVITESTYISDDIINVIAYDEWNSSEYKDGSTYSTISLVNSKIYKFYINKKDFNRLKDGDNFYLKGIKINNNSKDVLNFFDKKFKIGSWVEYIDYENSDSFEKKGIDFACFLSTPLENEYIINTFSDTYGLYTDTVKVNDNKYYSIDLIVKRDITGLDFNFYSNTPISSTFSNYLYNYIGNNIDISNTHVLDSDFESGIFESSDWNSGSNINLNNDLTITSVTASGIYELSIDTSDNTLLAKTLYNTNIEDINLVKDGDVLFLNSVDYDTRGKVLTMEILNPGTLYAALPVTLSSTSSGTGLDVSITVTGGNVVDTLTIEANGLGYSVGDTFTLLQVSSGDDATIIITSVDTNLIRLQDSYKVLSNTLNVIKLEEILTSTYSIISGLTAGGIFITDKAENRWGYLSKSKINKSKIKSGLFKRSYIQQSIIQNTEYDSNDKDYKDLSKIRNLVISDTIFSNNSNILSSATYLNSHFIGGSDIWNNGIIQNSILNGMTFSNGVVKESNWIDGEFTGGLFYNSRSFDGKPNSTNFYYNDNRVRSYYKKGTISATISNNRYSWINGLFTSGEFYKSDWESGIFNNGVFHYAKFYDGVFNNGTIGSKNISTSDTLVYNGVINYATVENAKLYSTDTVYNTDGTTFKINSLNKSEITWNDGTFVNGIFGSDNSVIYGNTISSTYSTNAISLTIPDFVTYSYTNSATNSISIMSTTSSIDEIRVTIDIDHDNIGDLIINLMSPNGKVINLKSFGIGNTDKLSNTTFTTNTSSPSLSSGTPPYNGVFKMDLILNQGYDSFTSSTTNFLEMIDVDPIGISGDWIIFIKDDVYGNVGTLNSWSIDLINNGEYVIRTNTNTATWNNGVFNGGQFINYAIWKNGVFNGGRFISAFGASTSGSYADVEPIGSSASYSWQNGEFNGGEFGNGELVENSTWFGGEFNGGVFKARVWNGGIFTFGEFTGSSTKPSMGGMSSSNAQSFVSNYESGEFYGLWRDGVVSDKKHKFITDKKIFTEMVRSSEPEKRGLSAKFKNALWLNGDFNHPTGEFTNSIWLDGRFELGKFNNSSFNPFVNRPGYLTPSFNTDDSCYWENGNLTNSDFYISKWEAGNFIIGTGIGMIFQSGVSQYMNAINVFWENGTWKNGNWYGSSFEYNGTVTDEYTKQILNRGVSFSGTQSVHIWNIFEENYANLEIVNGTSSSIISTNAGPSLSDPSIPPVGNPDTGPGSPYTRGERGERGYIGLEGL